MAGNSGAYTYAGGFPSSRSGSNYLVDVMFERLPAAIDVAAQNPAPGALDVPRTSSVGVWFSAPIKPGHQLAVSVNGTAIAGTTTIGPSAKSISFTPASPLPRDTLVDVSLTGVVSVEDAVLPPQAWSFRTTTSQDTSTPQTLFGALTPQTTMVSDPAPIELGTAFTPTRDGTITHVRFFKGGTENGGAHTGSIWSLAGERLATVAFTNETPSGWQSARLDTPLSVSAGTTYVVSYFAPQGHYSATTGFFATPHTAGDLTAPASNNGRYLYGPTGGFPSQSYGGANYFVDVAFSTGEVALGIADRTPAANATQVPRTSAVSVTFTEPVTTGATLALTTGTGSVTGDVARSVDARTLTFTPSAPLPADTVVTAGLTGVVSVDGDSMAPESWTFRTQALPPMTIISRSPVAGATDVPRTSPASVTFSEQLAPGATLTVSGPGGPVGGTTTSSADGRTLTFTPSAPMPADVLVTAGLTGVLSVDGASQAPESWTFRTQPVPPMTIASRSPVAGATAVPRTSPVTVTFSDQLAPGATLTVSAPGGTIAGTTSTSADGRTLSFTPSGTMAALTLHTVTVAGVVSVDGASLGTVSWSFTTEPRPIVTTTLFGNATPTAVSSDTRAVEVGTHFTPTQSGQVTAIRFYKAAANTGVHTVSLWRTNGTRLSRVTVTGETASGWQTMQLPTPIQLTSGTPYVVSYTALNGRVSTSTGFFTSTPFVSGPLRATRSQNGRYRYGTSGAFPNSVATGTNYFVDVVFRHEGP